MRLKKRSAYDERKILFFVFEKFIQIYYIVQTNSNRKLDSQCFNSGYQRIRFKTSLEAHRKKPYTKTSL